MGMQFIIWRGTTHAHPALVLSIRGLHRIVKENAGRCPKTHYDCPTAQDGTGARMRMLGASKLASQYERV